MERSEKKLSMWKSQYLSLGGRLTLIKSVVDGIPTYMMSLFPIPKSIERIQQGKEVFSMAGEQGEERI